MLCGRVCALPAEVGYKLKVLRQKYAKQRVRERKGERKRERERAGETLREIESDR